MSRSLALHHFTIFDLPPEDFIAVAGEGCCENVCLFIDAPDDLVGADGVSPLFKTVTAKNFRVVAAALERHGIGVTNLEFYPLGETVNLEGFRKSLALGAELGGRLAVTHLHDPLTSRAVDSLGRFCDLAAEFDLQVGLEFMGPSPGCPNLGKAVEITDAVARNNLGITVDLLHAFLTGAAPADLAAISPEQIAYAQMCDCARTPATGEALSDEDYMALAFSRPLPGAGVMPMADYVAALPQGIHWDVEVPQPDYATRGLSPRQHCGRAVEAARSVLGSVVAKP